MGAIAHYLEEAGIPTTSISLVRENTVQIRPPRALWVPFPLGRPFGEPNDPAFQSRVLRDALALLEREDGPVILEDFPDDAPGQGNQTAAGDLVCPVSFPVFGEQGEETLADRVQAEIRSLAPWHEMFVSKHGRTSATASRLPVREAARTIADFQATGTAPVLDTDFAALMHNASQDLRVWYQEAMTAQPGPPPSPTALADWFWGSTSAGDLLLQTQPVLTASEDRRLRQVGRGQWVPRAQKHRL